MRESIKSQTEPMKTLASVKSYRFLHHPRGQPSENQLLSRHSVVFAHLTGRKVSQWLREGTFSDVSVTASTEQMLYKEDKGQK